MIMANLRHHLARTNLMILITIIGISHCKEKCFTNNSSTRCCSGFRQINGSCEECIGYFGEGCSRSCPPQFYGPRCKSICSCSVNETCNQFVGCLLNLNSTCDQQKHSEEDTSTWQILIFLICVQSLISVLSISFALRKRMGWTHIFKITNLGSFKPRLNHSERNVEMQQFKRNHETGDDEPLHSSKANGQMSIGYNHIHFPKAAIVDICSDDYSTTKDQMLLHNLYFNKQFKSKNPDIHEAAEK